MAGWPRPYPVHTPIPAGGRRRPLSAQRLARSMAAGKHVMAVTGHA
jgi:hypothetical protein